MASARLGEVESVNTFASATGDFTVAAFAGLGIGDIPAATSLARSKVGVAEVVVGAGDEGAADAGTLGGIGSVTVGTGTAGAVTGTAGAVTGDVRFDARGTDVGGMLNAASFARALRPHK